MTNVLALQELPNDVELDGEELPFCSIFSIGCTTHNH